MSFWSTLKYYRPGTPPLVKAGDLADFVERFAQSGASHLESSLGISAKLKFGRGIDQDDLPTSCEELVEEVHELPNTWWRRALRAVGYSTQPKIFTYIAIRDIRWDSYETHQSFVDLAAWLRGLDDKIPVYRADIGLGTTVPSVLKAIERVGSPENEIDLQMYDVSLRLEPIEISLLPGDHVFNVGWMAMELSGDGYLFPWTLRDLVDRVEACSPLRKVAGLCRKIWPVPPQALDQKLQSLRQEMGPLWPYPTDAPTDWAWGIFETG